MKIDKIPRRWILRGITIILVLCSVCCVIFVWGSSNNSISNWLTSLHIINHRCGKSYGVFSFLNVGNGDACCIYNNDVVGFIDTGTSEYVGSLDTQMKQLNTTIIDFVVLSHPHQDHVGGYLHLVKQYTIKQLYILPYEENDFENLFVYKEIIEQSQNKGTEIVFVNHGDIVDIHGIVLKFYYFAWGVNEENQKSLIVNVTIGEKSCLLMGDADTYIENQLVHTSGIDDVDMLKVGHHGSADATHSEFLRKVRPEFAVISVGKNSYGHPSYEVCERLEQVGCELYRTDICKRIQFTVDKDNEIQVCLQ